MFKKTLAAVLFAAATTTSFAAVDVSVSGAVRTSAVLSSSQEKAVVAGAATTTLATTFNQARTYNSHLGDSFLQLNLSTAGDKGTAVGALRFSADGILRTNVTLTGKKVNGWTPSAFTEQEQLIGNGANVQRDSFVNVAHESGVSIKLGKYQFVDNYVKGNISVIDKSGIDSPTHFKGWLLSSGDTRHDGLAVDYNFGMGNVGLVYTNGVYDGNLAAQSTAVGGTPTSSAATPDAVSFTNGIAVLVNVKVSGVDASLEYGSYSSKPRDTTSGYLYAKQLGSNTFTHLGLAYTVPGVGVTPFLNYRIDTAKTESAVTAGTNTVAATVATTESNITAMDIGVVAEFGVHKVRLAMTNLENKAKANNVDGNKVKMSGTALTYITTMMGADFEASYASYTTTTETAAGAKTEDIKGNAISVGMNYAF